MIQGNGLDLVLGIAVVVATLTGPVLAVLVTRHVDERRQRRSRQLEIFRSLMGSRRTPLSPDRVKALNMVEIEFYGITEVQKCYQDVMRHINHPHPLPAEWHTRLPSLTTKLLSEMAKVLGYKLQQLDVLEGGYYPQGFVDLETEQQEVRRTLIEVLSGRRPLVVSPAAPAPPTPFPPPPKPPPLSGRST